MTLIQISTMTGSFVAMASDTRQILTNPFTKVKSRYFDTENKSERLTKYVLMGGGGYNYPTDRAKELIKKYADDAQFLNQFMPAVAAAFEDMLNDADYVEEVKRLHCFQVVLAGFNSDGSTGTLTFESGKELKYDHHSVESQISTFSIAPSADEATVTEELSFENPESYEQYPQKIVEHFAKVQKAHFLNSPENVSDRCVYNVIFRKGVREFQWFEGTLDL